MTDLTFIETQFPVSKLSKESYKERKANNSQTLTGLGKWWGRKPLVLVRAALLGLLLPASDDPKKDREIFLKLMTMDEEGLWRRLRGNIPAAEVYEYATETEREFYFTRKDDKWQWKKSASREDREHMQRRAFNRMGYDEKLSYCMRPEEIEGPSEEAWKEINAHLGTKAHCLPELVKNWERAGSDTSHGWGMPSAAEEAFLLRLLSWAAMSMVRISVPLAPFSPGRRSISSAEEKRRRRKFRMFRRRSTKPSGVRSTNGASSGTMRAGSMKRRGRQSGRGGTPTITYTASRRRTPYRLAGASGPFLDHRPEDENHRPADSR